MLKLIKRLRPAAQLPPHLHVHIDEHGREVICDESICRPRPARPFLFPPAH